MLGDTIKLCQKMEIMFSASNNTKMEKNKKKLERSDHDIFMYILTGLYMLNMNSFICVNNIQWSGFQNKIYRSYQIASLFLRA